MSQIPSGLLYASSHEWLKLDAAGTAAIGITDYAQSALGDVVYVQLPKVGATLKAGDVLGVVESVKAASDLYAPVAGKVVEVNAALEQAPETLNRDPYGEGWILKLQLADKGETAGLLSPDGYAKLLG